MAHWHMSYKRPEGLEEVEFPEYSDIGQSSSKENLGDRHTETNPDVSMEPIAYLYVPELKKLIFGPKHPVIVKKLVDEYGMDPKTAWETFSSNWSGRFDFDKNEISAQLLLTEDQSLQEMEAEIQHLLKSEFRKFKPSAEMINIIPFGKSGEPIFRPDTMGKPVFHFYSKGKWTTKEASGTEGTSRDTAETKSEVFVIHDVDRYCSDDYAINVAFQEKQSRYSIGVYVINWKVGISGYQEYWHYKKSERKNALSTYKQVVDLISKAVEDIEWNEVPMSLIKPIIRNVLDNIDDDHKEGSGVHLYNIYRADVPKSADWRATIYGPRYPRQAFSTMEEVFRGTVDTEVALVEKEDVGRHSVYKYRYAFNPVDNSPKPIYPSDMKITRTASLQHSASAMDWLKNNWRATIPLQVFLGLFASIGGTPELLAQRMQSGQTVPQIVQETQQAAEQQESEETPLMAEETETATEAQPETPFNNILEMTLNFEGGYSNHPNDPGGETNRGITRRTYEQYLQQHGLPTDSIDMQNIPEDHVQDIYRTMYWDRVGGDTLPPVVARQVFDFAVNSGPTRAVQYLQGIVGTRQDGRFGPQTQRAVLRYVAQHGENALARAYLDRRRVFVNNFVQRHPQFPGLLNRVNELQQHIPAD